MDQQSWAGKTINDRYLIEESIGQGGMSTVYRGLDLRLKRPVAVKIIHAYLSHNETFTKRFQREASTVAQLRHNNIVQVYDFDRAGETFFMVMEYVEGSTLRHALKEIDFGNRSPYDLHDIVRLMSKLCDAVYYANQIGLIHRDLKPANVLMTPKGEPVLTDFGVAKPVEGDDVQELTRTGAIMGTVAYMAPELVRGNEIDHRVDVYALGIILYEFLYGRRPYMGDSTFATMMKHIHDPIPIDRPMIVDCTIEAQRGLREIVRIAMAKSPDERYPNAKTLKRALVNINGYPTREEDSGEFTDLSLIRENTVMLSRNELLREATPLILDDPIDKYYRAQQKIDKLEAQLEKDLLQEKPLAELLDLRARRGEFLQALRQYRRFQKELEEELGLSPSPEIAKFHSRIMTARLALPNNLKPDVTSFIGRRLELNQLATMLLDPSNRLITILGQGGTGKTRLARALIKNLSNEKWRDFLHGAIFVGLAEVFDEASMLSAFATAFGVTLSAQKEVETHLIDYLQGRELLLVVDNFEHVVEHAHILFHFLDACPDLTCLVTSRHRLNLPGEQIYPLMGLQHTWHDDQVQKTADLDDGPRLFIDAARRINPSFHLEEDGLLQIYNVCELVDGNPLAIELAASWVRLLPTEQILRQLEKGYDILRTEDKVTATRHRNIRSVFAYSWDLLNEREQEVLAALSLFRGRFDQAGASAVANADITILSSLVDKSLVRVEIVSDETMTPNNRAYTMHEMVRQYAQEQLAEDLARLEEAENRFVEYFGDFLTKLEPILEGHASRRAWERIHYNIDNVIQAAQIAVPSRKQALLLGGIETIHRYYVMAGMNLEGITPLLILADSDAADSHENRMVQMRASGRIASLQCRMSQFDDALARIEAALEYWQSVHSDYSDQEIAFLFDKMAFVSWKRGQLDAGFEYVDRAFEIYTRLEDTYGIAMVLNQKGVLHYLRAQYPEAMSIFSQSQKMFESIGDAFNASRIQANIGLFYLATNQFQIGIDYMTDDLNMARLWNNKQKMAIDLVNLAWGNCSLKRYDEAIEYVEESLVYYREANDIEGESTALIVRADIAYYQGYRLSAQKDALQAFERSWEVQAMPKVLESIVILAHLLVGKGEALAGTTLAYFVRSHPKIDHLGHKRVHEYLQDHHPKIKEVRGEAETLGREMTDQGLLAHLRSHFDLEIA